MKTIIVAFLCSMSFCFAQKSFHFDTLLEYECKFTTSESDVITTQHVFTNSKNNSYYILVKDLDSLHYSLEFLAYDKYYSKVKVKKNKLFTSSKIDILNCETINKMSNNFKYRVRQYDFINLKDTIINNRLSKNYKLQYLKSKRKKEKKKIGTAHYIIKDSTDFHLPILFNHATAYCL